MSTAPLEPWWNLRQALIWIATRDMGWVAEAKPNYGFGGREVLGDSFDEIWAQARISRDTLVAYTSPDIAKFELLAKVAEGELKAAQDGKALPAPVFMGAVISDQDFLGTHVRRIETVQLGQLRRGDALIYQPRFIADQVRRLFPAVGGHVAEPKSEAERHLAYALEIEATAERRLADEFDAAIERGEDAPRAAKDQAAEPDILPPPKSAAVRRLEARKWYADERVPQWTGSPRGPETADDFQEIKDRFGLGRKDARKIRNDLAPPRWKESGTKDIEA